MAKHDSSQTSFTARDRHRLRRALATVRLARVYRRIAAVLAVAEGASISESARRLHVARTSVERWVARYRRRRKTSALEVLDDRHRGGRPRTATRLTKRWLASILRRDPRTLGYSATTWTVALLACYCREHHQLAISARTLRRRLRESGFRWKRPRYRYTDRAAHLAQKKGLSVAA
jgi:transposase